MKQPKNHCKKTEISTHWKWVNENNSFDIIYKNTIFSQGLQNFKNRKERIEMGPSAWELRCQDRQALPSNL